MTVIHWDSSARNGCPGKYSTSMCRRTGPSDAGVAARFSRPAARRSSRASVPVKTTTPSRTSRMTMGASLRLMLNATISAAEQHEHPRRAGRPTGQTDCRVQRLCIPTALYAIPGGAGMAWRLIRGSLSTPLCELGWTSLGVLELTALPSIDEERWVPMVQETDALLVGGGDALYLCYWMRQSGLADLLPSLREAVYVGVSGGAWASSASTSTSFTGRTTARGRRWRSRGAHWTRSATRERCAGSACATSPSTCSGAASPCGMWTRSRRSSRC